MSRSCGIRGQNTPFFDEMRADNPIAEAKPKDLQQLD